MASRELALKQRGILVCRPQEQAGPIVAALSALGAQVVVLPLIRIEWCPLAVRRAGLAALHGADWLVVTSANGAASLSDALARTGGTVPVRVRIATVGPATTGAVEGAGLGLRVAREAVSADSLVEALLPEAPGKHFVLWQGNRASPAPADRLRGVRARVERVVAYRTVQTRVDTGPVRADILAGRIHAVLFASSSQVEAAWRRVGGQALSRVAVVAIGPSTAMAVERFGLRVHAQAKTPSIVALTEAVVRVLATPDA